MNRKTFISGLALFFGCNISAQTNHNNFRMRGTWIDNDYLHCLQTCDSVEKKANEIAPRFIYIDSLNFLIYDFRFEHISKRIKLLSTPLDDSVVLASNPKASIKFANDSTLILMQNAGKTVHIFHKISSYATPGAGIQIYLHDYFFGQHYVWELIHIDSTGLKDTQAVLVTHTRILTPERKYITQYEFTDTYQTKVKNQFLFNLVFFDEDKMHMSVNNRLFALKKENNNILLFSKERLEYVLVPNSN